MQTMTLNYLTDSKSAMYVCTHILLFLFLPFLVSDEILQKAINTMQGNLKKLEKELETYKPLDDPDDQFVPVMKISFQNTPPLRLTVISFHSVTLAVTQGFLENSRICVRDRKVPTDKTPLERRINLAAKRVGCLHKV